MPESIEKNSESLAEKLLRVDRASYGKSYETDILTVYQLCVEMADRVSARRQTANSFYLSVNSLLLAAFAFWGGAVVGKFEVILVSVAGLLLCVMWQRNIHSYADLNSGKFSIINALEEMLPVGAFSEEWEVLDRGKNSRKFRPFHRVEQIVPAIFGVLYIALIVREVLN